MNNPNLRTDIEPSIIRLNFLIQEGFSRIEIENVSGINKHTLRSILQGKTKKITQKNHDKIKSLHSNYIINKTNDIKEIEAEELQKTLYTQSLKSYLWIVMGIVGILILGGSAVLGFLLRYIISLF